MNPGLIVRDGYDRLGERYRDADGIEPVRRWFLDETLRRIPNGADVLELGCGTGIDALELAAGRRYTGVDISARMLASASRRVTDGRFIRSDVTAMDAPEASFDAVVALYVLGHVPPAEHAPLFRSVHRWLRRGGVFCASFPVGDDDGVEDDWLGVPMYFGGIGRVATENGLRRAGFTIELGEERSGDDPAGGTETFFWAIARR